MNELVKKRLVKKKLVNELVKKKLVNELVKKKLVNELVNQLVNHNFPPMMAIFEGLSPFFGGPDLRWRKVEAWWPWGGLTGDAVIVSVKWPLINAIYIQKDINFNRKHDDSD